MFSFVFLSLEHAREYKVQKRRLSLHPLVLFSFCLCIFLFSHGGCT